MTKQPQLQRPKRTRSRVSNGTSLFLDHVDGRTKSSRRWRDIFEKVVLDYGGMKKASEREIHLCKSFATIAVLHEKQVSILLKDGIEATPLMEMDRLIRTLLSISRMMHPGEFGKPDDEDRDVLGEYLARPPEGIDGAHAD